MRRILIITCFILGNIGNAQSVNDTVLNELYIQAINNRFDLMLQSGETYFEINEKVERIKDSIKISNFHFVDRNNLFKTAIKKENKSMLIYRVLDSIVSKDTIDINFYNLGVRAKRGVYFLKGQVYFKRTYVSISCGGGGGYHPDMRFIYNRTNKKWELVENVFLKKE